MELLKDKELYLKIGLLDIYGYFMQFLFDKPNIN